MQPFRMKFMAILVIVVTLFGVTPLFNAPVFAAASQSLPPTSQPVDPTECRTDVTTTVNNMNKYTLIVLQDLNNPGFTHVHGAAYVGRNFNSTNNHVFGQNSSLTLADNALVVVGTTATGVGVGQLHIQKGNALFGQNLPSARMVMNSGGTATQDNTLSNTAFQSDIQTASAAFAAMPPNNSDPAVDGSGKLIFTVDTVTSNGLAIFDITADELFKTSANNQVDFVYENGINAANTTILVNISGTSANWTSNASLGNSVMNNTARILWNFHQATTITMNKQWYGAMLAPYATVDFGSQNMTGSIVVKDFTSAGEIHDPNFLTSNTNPLKDVCGTSNPGISIKKYTNDEDADDETGPVIAVGSTVTWTYVVTNTGNVPLSSVNVTDDKGVTPVYQSGDANSNGKLDTTETWIYQATGIATAGQYTNMGTAQGKSPDNVTVSDTDPSHYFGSNPGINIKKYTNDEDADDETGPTVAVGSTVTWKYVVTNVGNVALSDILVTDDKGVTPVYQSGDTNGNSKLDTTETWTYQATGTAVEGQYANVGTAQGKSPNNVTVSDTDPSHYFGSNPGISIKKYTNDEDADDEPGPVVAIGSTVTWTYVVSNSGNVALSDIAVSDDKGVTPVYQSGDTNNNGKLDLDETWLYLATGIATPGQYANIGSVQGTSPDDKIVTDTDPSHYFGSNAAIRIKKYTNDEDADNETGPIVAVGSTVTWTYVVTNAGNTTLSNITVTDNKGVTPIYQSGDTNGNSLLDVDEIWIYLATGTAAAGQYANIGTVQGESPEKVTVSDSDPSHYFGSDPAISIKKYTNGEDADDETGPFVAVGSTVTWTYVVSNAGNVPLSNVSVTDDKGVTPVYQSGDTNTNGKLDTDETWIYQATGVATAGQYANIGAVKGTSPDGKDVTDTDPSHYFGSNPAIVIKKYTNGEDADGETGPAILVGNPVTWTYVVTNAGNVPLSNITVTDDKGVTPLYQSGDTNNNGMLDLNESWRYQATGVATAGQYVNTGSVKGTSPDQREVTDTDPSHYIGTIPAPQPASLGDKVWNDANQNGVQDNDENPISGVKVELMTACDGTVLDTQTTGDDGLYLFDNLSAGDYVVRFTLPDGYLFATPNQGSADADSNADPATGCTPSITLDAGENDMTWDAGMYQPTVAPQPASLGDKVWNDANQNGVQDNGESPVAGVKVELLTVCDGTVLDTQTTGDDGLYLFDNLSAGNYVVRFTLPDGYVFTTANQGDDNADSDVDTVTGCTPSITLDAGEDDMSWDAGIYQPVVEPQPASLGNLVWYDTNQNGVQDNGEAGVADVTVELFDVCGGTLLKSTTTDANGLYLFDNLSAGNYVVHFVLPKGHIFTLLTQGADAGADSNADRTSGCTVVITLDAGENDMSWDAGIVEAAIEPPTEILPSALGDTVWVDLNKNGLQDNGEPGVAGVEVRLYTAGGTLVATQNTNSEGKYLFEKLQPGSYYVEFANVPGYSFTRYNVGEDRSVDDNPLVPWLDVTISDGGVEGEAGVPLAYTISFTNTDLTLPATDLVITATVPTGTSFLADQSSEGWSCTSAAAGGVCTLSIASLPANTADSAKFTVMVGGNEETVPQTLDFLVGLTQGSLARTEVVTLAPGETNLTVDAGVVRIEASLTTAAPTVPTNLPVGEQPHQQQLIFLPSVQSQQ